MGATKEEFSGKDQYKTLYKYEIPQHQVTVKAFALAKYAITRWQFEKFARETSFPGKRGLALKAGEWKFDSNADWENPGFSQTNSDPVTCVSWNDAQKFIQCMSGLTISQTAQNIATFAQTDTTRPAPLVKGPGPGAGSPPHRMQPFPHRPARTPRSAAPLSRRLSTPSIPRATCSAWSRRPYANSARD
jgi:hypothetical protein